MQSERGCAGNQDQPSGSLGRVSCTPKSPELLYRKSSYQGGETTCRDHAERRDHSPACEGRAPISCDHPVDWNAGEARRTDAQMSAGNSQVGEIKKKKLLL